MSILIKGMEMPKENDYTIAIVYGDGVVTEYHEDYWIRGADGEKQLGTAVPVPPHGRLIDADALMEIISKVIGINASIDQRNEATDKERRCLWWFEEQVNIAPTIIPAEEGK